MVGFWPGQIRVWALHCGHGLEGLEDTVVPTTIAVLAKHTDAVNAIAPGAQSSDSRPEQRRAAVRQRARPGPAPSGPACPALPAPSLAQPRAALPARQCLAPRAAVRQCPAAPRPALGPC